MPDNVTDLPLVMFAANAGIYASRHVTSNHDQKFWLLSNFFRGLKIGENCCIGHGAMITDGVQLGENSIVGPNVVVRGTHRSGSKIINTN
tara:strand:- start:11991 stop:12260 length:270 start_codon:yes stop_codon:yes gene_type:complete